MTNSNMLFFNDANFPIRKNLKLKELKVFESEKGTCSLVFLRPPLSRMAQGFFWDPDLNAWDGTGGPYGGWKGQ